VVYCALAPYRQPEVRAVIRVPAVLLLPRIFSAKVAVIPTGIRTYPATVAHGVLTITNGSIIGQYIPAGFTIGNVATDKAVYVPGGSANSYGWAQVPAHALNAGQNGNLPALAINSVVGSSVYVRNLSVFSGGHDSYSVKYATAEDKRRAITKAQQELASMSSGLHYPCTESSNTTTLTWHCQFVTYSLPSYMHVSSIRILGKNLLIAVTFTPRQVRVGMK